MSKVIIHCRKCIENISFHKMTILFYFSIPKSNSESIRHFFSWPIYKTCHIFYTRIGWIYFHFVYITFTTIDKHKYTSANIYLRYFGIKFTCFTSKSSHIATCLFKKFDLDPLSCYMYMYVHYIVTLNPTKLTYKSKIYAVHPDYLSIINSKWVHTLYLPIKENKFVFNVQQN